MHHQVFELFSQWINYKKCDDDMSDEDQSLSVYDHFKEYFSNLIGERKRGSCKDEKVPY